MHRSLTPRPVAARPAAPRLAALALLGAASLGAGTTSAATGARAHALLPGQQTVRTLGERAFVRLRALNGRRDVAGFVVEVFEGGGWAPSRLAVATPERFDLAAAGARPDEAAAGEAGQGRVISLLVDLGGLPRRSLRVCTKSLPAAAPPPPAAGPRAAVPRVNTRVCATVVVERFQP